MTPCDVCGRDGEPLRAVRPVFHEDHDARKTHVEWVAAESPGAACSPECATFVYVKAPQQTPDQRALTAWAWRARRAQSHGVPFEEPPPFNEAERQLLVLETTRSMRGAK